MISIVLVARCNASVCHRIDQLEVEEEKEKKGKENSCVFNENHLHLRLHSNTFV